MNLYDAVLKRGFSGFGAKTLFRLGLKARALFFAMRNFFGVLTYRKKKCTVSSMKIGKILVVRTDRLGDIILSTPALRALRARFPEATIDYVVQKKCAPVLNCYCGWNCIYEANVSDSRQLKALGREIYLNHYDVAIVEHPAKYAYQLAKDSRADCIVGWNAKGFGYMLTIGFPDDRGKALRHQVENNLMLLAPLGVHDLSPEFPVRETDLGSAQYLAFCESNGISPGERFIAVHPGSYAPRVRWLPERFGAVIDRAQKYGVKVVLFGGVEDREIMQEVLSKTSAPPIVAAGVFGLEGLVSFLKHAAIFIGNSTGPMHIAASVGTWTIAIFGTKYPMDRAELWKPWGPKGIVVSSNNLNCERCIPWTCNHKKCLTDVTVDDVWRRVETILNSFAGGS